MYSYYGVGARGNRGGHERGGDRGREHGGKERPDVQPTYTYIRWENTFKTPIQTYVRGAYTYMNPTYTYLGGYIRT